MSACSDQVHLGSPLLGVVDALLLSVALFLRNVSKLCALVACLNRSMRHQRTARVCLRCGSLGCCTVPAREHASARWSEPRTLRYMFCRCPLRVLPCLHQCRKACIEGVKDTSGRCCRGICSAAPLRWSCSAACAPIGTIGPVASRRAEPPAPIDFVFKSKFWRRT